MSELEPDMEKNQELMHIYFTLNLTLSAASEEAIFKGQDSMTHAIFVFCNAFRFAKFLTSISNISI